MNQHTPRSETASPLGRRSNRFRSRSLEAAAVGLTAATVAESASATIIDFDVSLGAPGSFSIDLGMTVNGQLDSLKAAGMGGTWDLTLEAPAGNAMAMPAIPGSSVELHATAAMMDNDLVLLARGDTVDSSLVDFASDGRLVNDGVPLSTWTPGTIGYAGFRFDNAGTTNYGWLKIRIEPGLDNFTVLQSAYEDSGGLITAGSIPEPSTAILLGLGLVGLSALARKRRTAAPIHSAP